MFDKKGKEKKVLESSGNIILKSRNAVQIGETPAKIVLGKENFSVFPENQGIYLFSYREVIDLIPADYQLKLLFDKKELVISKLGYQYEDFVRIFVKLRNETILKDLLFQETLKKAGLEAEFSYFGAGGALKQQGKAEFRFYQTSLAVLPESGELIKIPLSDVSETKTDNFQIEISMEGGEKIVIAKLGEKFDLFKEALRGCLNELSLNVQNFVKGIWPEIDFSALNEISLLIKEGKATSKKAIEAVSPDLFKKLEAALMKTEVKEEYGFLKSQGKQDKSDIGFKKGLMGKLTGDYFWFFIPVCGNAVAFETAGEKETGRATYFFRAGAASQTDDLIKKINRGLSAINFRREPIYLPEEKLEEPEYAKYKFSMAKIPEIKLMRELFIGRIIHKDDKQWQADVKKLLEFNVKGRVI
ncbi:MAG: hypothetical protein M1127_00555 [Patescibacteria group bacterium]|nr:hypothetical protein [Patescibacteria group bacterium]